MSRKELIALAQELHPGQTCWGAADGNLFVREADAKAHRLRGVEVFVIAPPAPKKPKK